MVLSYHAFDGSPAGRSQRSRPPNQRGTIAVVTIATHNTSEMRTEPDRHRREASTVLDLSEPVIDLDGHRAPSGQHVCRPTG